MKCRRFGVNKVAWFGLTILWSATNGATQAQNLEVELQRANVTEIVEQAKLSGDAARGAIVFFQPTMACSKCHSVNGQPTGLGPDLASVHGPLSDTEIVESILIPSKAIRKGFESASVVTEDGQVQSGILVEQSEKQVILRNSEGQLLKFNRTEVDRFVLMKDSIMPVGQVNQLNSRQQFLDLLRFLFEIRDGGVLRARQLQPSESLLTLKIPEYELHLDHAGLIKQWDSDSLARGEAIYLRVCANCHGTRKSIGSLPTALRFGEGKFKNGSDPFSLYNTLTRGFGFMPAQSWMVPRQKYDVIHYIRESFLRNDNPSQFRDVDANFLAGLPKGETQGPEPSKIELWSAMDYGSSLTHVIEAPGERLNIAYKGMAIRVDPGAGGVARGSQWMLFDTDTLRMAAAWHADGNAKGNRFIDWRDIQFNGQHGIHPRIEGEVTVSNPIGPGWANPDSGSFEDNQRIVGRDGRRYGPLPRQWARFLGYYHIGNKVLLNYSVGTTSIFELPGQVARADGKLPITYLRSFNVGPRQKDLVLQVADWPAPHGNLVNILSPELNAVAITSGPPDATTVPIELPSIIAGAIPSTASVRFSYEEGRLLLRLPAGGPLRFSLWTSADQRAEISKDDLKLLGSAVANEAVQPLLDLSSMTRGGPARWPQMLETKFVSGSDEGALAVDVLTSPEANPWLAQLRFTGVDFFSDGRLAACTWDGDVWTVEVDDAKRLLQWRRIATGLYQPLGIKIIQEKIHLTCRDQLVVLHDLNGDGEIDFYQCLNNDHQVTEHFHEFAMGLQVDQHGNFYYAKSARHALPAIVPHHGTLLRVSRDGSRTDILANGFRAANGVCMNPDGSFVVTDQEGHWNPKNRINWVTLDPSGKPKFYGNMFGYHDVTDPSDSAMQPPLCWITNAFDRSPAELLWVESPKWGPLDGALLNLSYGYGKVFLVQHEKVGNFHQGGMIQLPIDNLPTGVMRGRFHPKDQHLYLCGMFAWAGNATAPGGLYRLRATGKPFVLPAELNAKQSGLYLKFTEPLDVESVLAENVSVKSWSLKRSARYGSDHRDEQTLAVKAATLDKDGVTVHLDIDSLAPTWCMEIQYQFRTHTGQEAKGVIHNTIHLLGTRE